LTNMSNAGIAPPVVMSISGHRTVATFLRYNISTSTAQQDALKAVIASRKKA
jgi:hypothetical protein